MQDYGIIMGNSSLSNKNIGKIVVANNDNNGVAEGINNYVLI